MKRAIVDTSSAILLYKACLFKRLMDAYRVVLAASVFRELTVDGYPGADWFRGLNTEVGCRVLEPEPHTVWHPADSESRMLSGAGERDTLRLYHQGAGEFVVVDDRSAAVACKRRHIPYINALLTPRVLYLAGHCSYDRLHRSTLTLMTVGRYADAILRTAENLPDASLQPFLP